MGTVVNTVLHDCAVTVGLKMVFVPPASIRTLGLGIDKTSLGKPLSNFSLPFHGHCTKMDGVMNDGAFLNFIDGVQNVEAQIRWRDGSEVFGREKKKDFVQRSIQHNLCVQKVFRLFFLGTYSGAHGCGLWLTMG